MKSSEPVFTRKNPFPAEPHLPKSHYNPSKVKKIPKKQKSLALSPVRFTRSVSPPESPTHTDCLSPEDQRFLDGSHRVVLCPSSSVEGNQKFTETWPSTDQSSSPASTSVSQPQHTAASQEPSVMKKYIERFRYGMPQSRGEREKLASDGEADQPYWWMSPSSLQPSSSTSNQSKECYRGSYDGVHDGKGNLQDLISHHPPKTLLSPTREQFDLSVLALSDSSHCEPEEPEIIQLQERANRLLQKSEHSHSSGSIGVQISTEGLGCSDFSSPVSVDEPIRRPMVPSLMDTANLLTHHGMSREDPFPAPTTIGSRGSRIRPEDDILLQWRLRRKMEQARQWSHATCHSSALNQPMLNRLVMQTQPGPSCTPAPLAETGNPAPHSIHEPVPPVSSNVYPISSFPTKEDFTTQSHLGFFSPSTSQSNTRDPQIPSSFHQSHQRGQRLSPKTKEESINKHSVSSSLQPTRSTEEVLHSHQEKENVQDNDIGIRQREKLDKKSASPSRKKKSNRLVGDRDATESNQHTAMIKGRNARSQEQVSCQTQSSSKKSMGHRGGQSSTNGTCLRAAPPSSPIHSTLEQVVSEVLFSGANSPVHSITPHSSASPTSNPSEPSQVTNTPQSTYEPCEVIGQLMQEAEDSDGLEFEDDSLLIVLRQQRKWVKEQLCEVDLMLEKLHKD
ncbi:proline and serine-rich protein 3 [Trichomycterus rosablanca]|uniref:proline and serine-rich protein 3 n=1 Tax=Trichomycterus rosablanca TaxID=2290929 RepID=UPI002F354536